MKYWPHLLLTVLAERVCSYVIKKTESIAANSTAELISWGFKRLFKKEKVMEQATQSLPDGLGELSESYAAGVASAECSVVLPKTAFGLSLTLDVKGSLDATVLIPYLAAKAGGEVPAEIAKWLTKVLAAT